VKTDLFAEITAAIAAQLEQGVRPWAKPWTDREAGFSAALPHNVKGRPYRGANVFWLMMAAQAHGYAEHCWLTFKQAKELGGNVRKGEHGRSVFFWKFDTVKDAATGEDKRRVMLRQYTVFNVAQCENLDKRPAPPAPRPEPERIAAAESMIEATGAQIGHGGPRAFYSPAFDLIQLPPRDAFKGADDYYSTAFHELGHWTGHASRLDRKQEGRFGSPEYAFEELVAELTSAFVCGSQGFASVAREDHAAYLQNWLKVLNSDPKAFITASSLAQKAADYILAGEQAEEEEEPESEQVAAVAIAQAA
jgi:antirestriction protein ArdC